MITAKFVHPEVLFFSLGKKMKSEPHLASILAKPYIPANWPVLGIFRTSRPNSMDSVKSNPQDLEVFFLFSLLHLKCDK